MSRTILGRRVLEREEAVHFRGRLREARLRVLADAEATSEILTALDSLGAYLANGSKAHGLGGYKASICDLASTSPLCGDDLATLYERLRADRNDHMHEGASARRTARCAVSLALILENAMEIEGKIECVDDLMTVGPTCAELWHTIKMVRQTMLVHQFSYLPIRRNDQWFVLPDYELARFLRSHGIASVRNRTVEEALEDPTDPLELERPHVVPSGTRVADAFDGDHHVPRLVVTERGGLLGILTGFDLL